MSNGVEFTALIKEVKMKTLVSSDQQLRITLESLYGDDVTPLLKNLAGLKEVVVTIKQSV